MYTKLTVAAGTIKAIPTSVAVSRDARIIAVTIPLTSGIMLQAFRVTGSTLVPITINGQMTVARSPVSVSPDGTYLLVGAGSNAPKYEIWKYNTVSGQYDKFETGVTDTARGIATFEWLENDVFIRLGRYALGSTYRGSVNVFRIGSTSSTLLFEKNEGSAYAARDVTVSPDRKNFIVGFNGSSNIADSYYWDGTTTSFVGRTVVGFQYGEYFQHSKILLGSRGGSGPGTKIYTLNGTGATEILGPQSQTLTEISTSGVRVIDNDIALVNNPDGSFAYFVLNPNNNLFEATTVPLGLAAISSSGKQYTWSRYSQGNKLLVAMPSDAATLEVYVVSVTLSATLKSELNRFTTTGVLDAPVVGKIGTILNPITTQIISGEDQATGVFNLKLTSAFVQSDPGDFGRFSYESFNQQYMHGKTVISPITSQADLYVVPQIETETFMPSIETAGDFTLPPQFEGATLLPLITMEATLKADDFFFGDNVIPPIIFEAYLTGGEEAAIYQYIESITTEGVVDAEFAITDTTVIESITTDGYIDAYFALRGDTEINRISSDGFINAPWTAVGEVLLNQIETNSVLVYNFEGGAIDLTIDYITSSAEALVIYPETITSDVFIDDFQTEGEIDVVESFTGDTLIPTAYTEGELEVNGAIIGDTVIPSISTDGYFIKTIQIDTVMYLRMLESNGFLEMINGATIKSDLNKITTEAFVKMLRRKRYFNIA